MVCELRSLCEECHEYRVDGLAIDQKLASPPAFFDHATAAHDPQHRFVDFHRAGGDLAQASVLEKKSAGTRPGFEAIALAAQRALADQDCEVGDAVGGVDG